MLSENLQSMQRVLVEEHMHEAPPSWLSVETPCVYGLTVFISNIFLSEHLVTVCYCKSFI